LSKKSQEQLFIEQITDAQGIIHKVCRMYCFDNEHRKDLFQEILIQLWKSYTSFRGDSKFSTWMYRVSLNVAIQDLRKVKKKQSLFTSSEIFRDISEEKTDDPDDENLRLLYAAISHLNKIEKAIMMLHLENKSNEEIAAIIGITQNYVRVKMNRIKVKLKNRLIP